MTRPTMHRTAALNAQVGSYLWAKGQANAFDLDTVAAANRLVREMHRPTSSAHHGTVRVLGKPYHWRQDYTGQLKLAAGESPW